MFGVLVAVEPERAPVVVLEPFFFWVELPFFVGCVEGFGMPSAIDSKDGDSAFYGECLAWDCELDKGAAPSSLSDSISVAFPLCIVDPSERLGCGDGLIEAEIRIAELAKSSFLFVEGLTAFVLELAADGATYL
jgi:hypothetical protein